MPGPTATVTSPARAASQGCKEYRIIDLSPGYLPTSETVNETINDLARDGWRFVQVWVGEDARGTEAAQTSYSLLCR